MTSLSQQVRCLKNDAGRITTFCNYMKLLFSLNIKKKEVVRNCFAAISTDCNIFEQVRSINLEALRIGCNKCWWRFLHKSARMKVRFVGELIPDCNVKWTGWKCETEFYRGCRCNSFFIKNLMKYRDISNCVKRLRIDISGFSVTFTLMSSIFSADRSERGMSFTHTGWERTS